jgi:putative transposase
MAGGKDQRMTKKHFTEEQIVAALREAESGGPIVEVCRRFGVTETTFFRWRKQFAGMAIAEMHRLKRLEDENKRLKSLVTDLTLDKAMLQSVSGGRAGCWASTARLSATRAAGTRRSRCGCGSKR